MLALTFGLEHIGRSTSAMTAKTAMTDLTVNSHSPEQLPSTAADNRYSIWLSWFE